MNEQMTAREALAAAIHNAYWMTPWEDTPYQADGERNGYIIPNEQELFLEEADAVIAHLWERAMQPEVVRVVADAIMTAYQGNPNGFMAMGRASTEKLLTALIGPNPKEGDDE